MTKNGCTDAPWDGSKSRFSIDQLKKAVPRAMLAYANRIAKGREVTKGDLHLPYKEPNGTINIHGVSAALGRLNQTQGPSAQDKAEARAELLAAQKKARSALGMPPMEKKMAATGEFAKISEGFFERMRRCGSVPLDSLQAPALPTEPSDITSVPALLPDNSPIKLTVTYPDGYNVQSLEAPTMTIGGGAPAQPPVVMPIDIPHTSEELAATAAKQKSGAIETDLRPLPNFRKLGIDRAAGPAIVSELAAFAGHTKADGSAVGPEDFYSTGALLANNDLITNLMTFFPTEELARMATMMGFRAIKSDQDHSRKVASGPFTVVAPKLGSDPGTPLHRLHPLLGVEPYTALIGRLLFPLAEEDPTQKANVEMARRGRLLNLSALFAYESVSCATCGPLEVRPSKSQGMITGFMADTKHDMFQVQGEDSRMIGATLRIPSDVPGGFVYHSISRLKPSAGGILQIDPIPESQLQLNSDTRLLVNMDRFSFFGMNFTLCRLHGQLGGRLKDGRQVIGQFTNVKSVLNMAAVDRGAIGDARLVPDPDAVY